MFSSPTSLWYLIRTLTDGKWKGQALNPCLGFQKWKGWSERGWAILSEVSEAGQFYLPCVAWGEDGKARGWAGGRHLHVLHSVPAFSLGQAVRSLLIVPAPCHMTVGAGRLLGAGQMQRGQLGGL